MNKNELRLGNDINLIVSNGIETLRFRNGKITELSKDKVRVNDIVFGYDNLVSIPLTEKSILKLNFCKDNTENNKTYLSPIHNGIILKIYFNRFGVAKLFVENNLDIEIPFIHTIQNLYSLLTNGGELVFSNNA